MKTVKISVRLRNKTEKEGSVLIPDTLQEMIAIVGPDQTFKFALAGFMENARLLLKKKERKHLKVQISRLSPEQREGLMRLGLLEK